MALTYLLERPEAGTRKQHHEHRRGEGHVIHRVTNETWVAGFVPGEYVSAICGARFIPVRELTDLERHVKELPKLPHCAACQAVYDEMAGP